MNVRILAVGKLKERYLVEGVQEYRKRLTKYGRLSIVELKDQPLTGARGDKGQEQVLQIEGERILTKLTPRAFCFALDRCGRERTSLQLASQFEELALQGINHLDFIIGGSLGLASFVLERSDFVLSFSQFTFPHQLMRLILAEQIYRAFTILAGESYHK